VRVRPRNVRRRSTILANINLTFTDTQIASGFSGYFDKITNTNQRGWMTNGAAWIGYVTGSSCLMNTSAQGDTSPFRIRIDGGAETTPVWASNQGTLFSGLADIPHLVVIRPDNSTNFGNTSTTAAVLSVTGSNPAVSSVGVQYNLNDPAFPGLHTFCNLAFSFGNLTPTYTRTNPGGSGQAWGPNGGSVHFRGRGTGVWVFTYDAECWYSVNGAAMQKASLAASTQVAGTNCLEWKQVVGLTLNPASYQEVILNGSSLGSISPTIQSVLVAGSTASILASSNTKVNVCFFGASQVQGPGASLGATDMYQAMPLFPTMAVGGSGQSGYNITQATTAMPAFGTSYPNKHTMLLSIGINSADDANFQGDYINLIQACLTAGWTKVICRGLVQASVGAGALSPTFNDGKNTKIQNAVASFSSSAVVYATVAGWVASTDGSVGIHMPDGSHPNIAGYATMATYILRDHSTILPG
jgi:hypothetical protein